jgi:hypothetical protein
MTTAESAKSFMAEERFWEIIENSDRGKTLKKALGKLSEKEIMGYRYWWEYFHAISYRQALWAVAYVVLGGCGDDSFDYFRYWLLTRGKKVFFDALDDADSLCDEFEKLEGDDYPEWEDVAYYPKEVFEEKFGGDFYEEEEKYDFGLLPSPEMVFEWEEDDEESLRKVCPRTFEKWWDNDRF